MTRTAINIEPPPRPNEAETADVNKLTIQSIKNVIIEISGVLDIISKINKPIVSTSANISGNPIPENFHNIDKELKMKVNFILEEKMINYAKTPSKIYKIENNKMILIR